MNSNITHDLAVPLNQEDKAKRAFVSALRVHVLQHMSNSMKSRYEDYVKPKAKKRGNACETPEQIHKALKSDFVFKAYSSARTTAQEMVFDVVSDSVDREFETLKANVKPVAKKGSLTLDDTVEIPKSVSEIDVHLAPGSYHAEYAEEDFATGAVYDNAIEVFSFGQFGKGSDDIYAIKKIQPLCDVLIVATILDDTTRSPLAGASVSLYDAEGNRVVSKMSDDKGIAEFIVECEQSSELEAILDGYDSKKVVLPGSNEEEVSVQISLDPLEKLIVEDRIELNPIYFDFDKSNIKTQAAFELDKLVQIMNKYPEMVVLVNSYTDNRGPASYNDGLSSRRAKSTVQYIVSKGIDEARISGNGKGENDPKVDCGAKCTEDEHQLNRRSEFIIVSGGPKA